MLLPEPSLVLIRSKFSPNKHFFPGIKNRTEGNPGSDPILVWFSSSKKMFCSGIGSGFIAAISSAKKVRIRPDIRTGAANDPLCLFIAELLRRNVEDQILFWFCSYDPPEPRGGQEKNGSGPNVRRMKAGSRKAPPIVAFRPRRNLRAQA